MFIEKDKNVKHTQISELNINLNIFYTTLQVK